jgi:hypothetical protein
MKRWIHCSPVLRICVMLVAACSSPPAAAPQEPVPPAAPTHLSPAATPGTADPSAGTTPSAAAATPAPPAVPAAPATKTLAAIDVFGARHASPDEIIATSGLVVGSAVVFGSEEFGEQMKAANERLKQRYHFPFVEVSPISYFASSPDAGKVFITIDVVEREDAARLSFAREPSKDVPDPDGLIAAWLAYEEALWPLQRSGELRPPFTCKGGMHCALGFNHPQLEQMEDAFIEKAPGRMKELTAVLRGDRQANRRAAAAFVLAYGKDRKEVVDALLPSIDDPNAGVRNNVVRVLVMIQKDADTVVVPLKAALHVLRFPTTTDRNKAGYLLANIAEHASPAEKMRIAREAGDTLLVMAAMQQPNNRDPAIKILEAISGETHGTDVEAWRIWLKHQRARK